MNPRILYMETYAYYRTLIENGTLEKGTRMPSLRRCCRERSISKTTAENAYFQLAADGYIVSRERSGFFVSSAGVVAPAVQAPESMTGTETPAVSSPYDFSRVGEDASAFCFGLWQKYMKSVMRDTSALISYGEAQGEAELREELACYVRKRRNIYCSAENIVVGASTQNLLSLLLPMLREKGLRRASVPTASFSHSARVFADFGFRVGYRDKQAEIIYVSPSHMTAWGEVMSLKRRYEIHEHSRKGHLILEDDYQNDFNYSGQPCPSIYALSGGEHVVYMGSFSRVLLPSIRISYMILPRELVPLYARTSALYGQTSSKAEQLALCRFLRDDQLDRHVRKIKRLYGAKRELLREILEMFCDGKNYVPLIGESGTELAVRTSGVSEASVRRRLESLGMACRIVPEKNDRYLLIFSCGIISVQQMEELRQKLAAAS